MSVIYLLEGVNEPVFANRVGFTSDPSVSNGYYEDVDNDLIRIGYKFDGIGVNILSGSNSFTTELPYPISTILPLVENVTLRSTTSGVLSAIAGNITASRNVTTGIVTLTIGFPILTSLTGLPSAKINIQFEAKVTF